MVLFSCINPGNKNQPKENLNTEINVDSSTFKKQEAIKLLNEVDIWMKKGVMKELSPSIVNEKVTPLMMKYQKILAELNKEDSISVQQYRIEQINKMIDLQIQQNQ
jgi:hypothetical protein